MKKNSKKENNNKKILLVEGADDKRFFTEFLPVAVTNINKRNAKNFIEELIQTPEDAGWKASGKSNLINMLEMKILQMISQYQVIGIIVDADEDPKQTFEDILKIFQDYKNRENEENANEYDKELAKKLNLPSKPNNFAKGEISIGIFVLPSFTEEGALETLCLQSIEESKDEKYNIQALDCKNQFIKCVEKTINVNKSEDKMIKDKHKKEVQLWLAFQSTLASQDKCRFASTPGFAAKEGYWDFNADCFKELKNFLTEGFSK